MGLVKRLQETAGALLLVRGVMGREGREGSMARLMTGSFLDRDDAHAAAVGHELDEVPAGPSAEASASDVANGESLGQAGEPSFPLPHQRTLESQRAQQRSHTLSAFDPRSEKSQILRAAFGSNALAHKELRVDIFTTVAVFLAFLKLVAVRGNPWLTVGGLFFVFGWASVHVLLILFHLRELDEIEMSESVRLVRIFNTELKSQVRGLGISVFIGLHLPLFGYPAYVATFRPLMTQHAEHPRGQLVWLQLIFETLGLVFVVCATIMLAVAVLMRTLGFGVPLFSHGRSWLGSAGSITSAWVVFAWLIYSVKPVVPDGSSDLFAAGTMWYYLFDVGSYWFSKAVSLVCFLLAMGAAYYALFFMPWKSDRARDGRVIAGNLICISIMFAIFLYRHDESRTAKPWWTEFLG